MTSLKVLGPYAAALIVGLVLGYIIATAGGIERFVDVTQSTCEVCRHHPCDCRGRGDCDGSCGGRCKGGCKKQCDKQDCDRCPQIDWSKYVLKASIPPCPPQPDLSRYMLKSECPAPPDMSRYILKSAVPPCPPCISTCNKPCKIGECPPCPRPRCPVVTCPEPKSCPPCAPVEPPRCPEPVVKCKADYVPEEPWMVRPLLSSFGNMSGL
jgi:hypothetical protein